MNQEINQEVNKETSQEVNEKVNQETNQQEEQQINKGTSPKRHKKLKKTLSVVLAIIMISVVAGAIYVNDYYHATTQAEECLVSTDTVTVTVLDNKNIIFAPTQPTAGLIFYPGGKVETSAYAPLMQALAEQGMLCVIVDMPFHLAVLDQNAANGIQAMYPEITTWYIGGHSLGGAMAAVYAQKHADEYTGLILLAAYSTADLTDSNLSVLSIYGSNDGVLNQDKMQKYASNLPADAVTYVIDGGCHAYFGSYGAQNGDGTPDITSQEQITQTVEAIVDFIYQ